MQEPFDPSNPYAWLKRYKTTTNPKNCRVCDRVAHYVHPTLGHLCAAHLLDLANVGELNWKWDDWEDVWRMTTRLLSRRYGGAVATAAILRKLAVISLTLDGYKICKSCTKKLGIEWFNKDSRKPDNYSNECKTCYNKYRRSRRKR